MPVAPEYLHLVYPGESFPAFLYGRASRDPHKKGRSVADQIDSGRALCDAHGWPVVDVFDQDVDRSASRHARKSRDDFEALLAGIEARKCRIVVAFEASRYYRDLEAYLRLRNACASAGVLLCYNGQIFDLSKREDRKATAMDALAAEDEGEGIRDRVLRTTRSQAEKGAPHGRILYGYARRYDPDTGDLTEQYEHPRRGAEVREVFERIAAGETTYAILKDFAERGILHGDMTWQDHHVSEMLRNPAYIGRRVHQGIDVGEAAWPAIVDEETYWAVQRIVSAPGRARSHDTAVKHLLSGIALCGECTDCGKCADESRCDGQPVLRVMKNRGYLSYQCDARFDTVLRQTRMDAYVEEALVTWLSSDAAVAAFRPEGGDKRAAAARIRLEQLRDQLDDARKAATRFRPDGKPELSVASLGAMEAQLEPQIDKAKAEAEEAAVPPLLRSLVGNADADRVWADLDMSQRRMVLRLCVTVRLYKARANGVRSIEPGRIRLSFYGQPGFRPYLRAGA